MRKCMELLLAAMLVFVALASTASELPPGRHAKHPIILIPGLSASVVRARLVNKPTRPHFLCSQNSDWYTLWLSIEQLVAPVIDCFVDNITPIFNESTGQYEAPEGVELDPYYDFGGIGAIEYFNPGMRNPMFEYYHDLIEAMKDEGYVPSESLRGAPYDWRLSPDGLRDYFEATKTMIEETYELNNQTASIIVSHSMGCIIGHTFLNIVSDSWKSKYIRAFISLGGPYGGSGQIIRGLTTGFNLGISILPESNFYKAQTKFPVMAWMFPNPKVFGDETLIQTPSKSYSAFEASQFFRDLELKQVEGAYYRTLPFRVENLSAPKVDTYVIYSSGTKTEIGFIFDEELKIGEPSSSAKEIKYEDGDGTTTIRSAETVMNWKKQHQEKFAAQFFNVPKKTHIGLVTDGTMVKGLKKLIQNANSGIREMEENLFTNSRPI